MAAELAPKPCPQHIFTLGHESRPQKVFTLELLQSQCNPGASDHPVGPEAGSKCPHPGALGPEAVHTTIALAHVPQRSTGATPHYNKRDAAGDLAATAELAATADFVATAAQLCDTLLSRQGGHCNFSNLWATSAAVGPCLEGVGGWAANIMDRTQGRA
jgi:hypothetical protein